MSIENHLDTFIYHVACHNKNPSIDIDSESEVCNILKDHPCTSGSRRMYKISFVKGSIIPNPVLANDSINETNS